MTAFPKLAILDVGHGNSAVLHDRDAILVFDAGLGNILYEYILENNIQEIEALLISHSDADHLAGIAVAAAKCRNHRLHSRVGRPAQRVTPAIST